MSDWSEAEEISGRKAFDLWRFTEVERAIPWDWADMGSREKRRWIERAETRAEPGCADRTGDHRPDGRLLPRGGAAGSAGARPLMSTTLLGTPTTRRE